MTHNLHVKYASRINCKARYVRDFADGRRGTTEQNQWQSLTRKENWIIGWSSMSEVGRERGGEAFMSFEGTIPRKVVSTTRTYDEWMLNEDIKFGFEHRQWLASNARARIPTHLAMEWVCTTTSWTNTVALPVFSCTVAKSLQLRSVSKETLAE